MLANPRQDRLVESIEGIHVVDAGPGTGKTHTITRRYINILSSRPGIRSSPPAHQPRPPAEEYARGQAAVRAVTGCPPPAEVRLVRDRDR